MQSPWRYFLEKHPGWKRRQDTVLPDFSSENLRIAADGGFF